MPPAVHRHENARRYALVPETKGRTLEDMLRYFQTITGDLEHVATGSPRASADGDGDKVELSPSESARSLDAPPAERKDAAMV